MLTHADAHIVLPSFRREFNQSPATEASAKSDRVSNNWHSAEMPSLDIETTGCRGTFLTESSSGFVTGTMFTDHRHFPHCQLNLQTEISQSLPSVHASPMLTAPTIRLIIVDDHEIVLAGLKVLLSRHRGLECVGSAANGYEAVDLASRLRPDVAIMDLKMPSCDGLEATRRLRKHVPETKVLAFSMRPAASVVVAALRAGVLGYVSKSSENTVLIEAIQVAAKGKRFIDPHLTEAMLRTILDDQIIGAPSTLTRREHEVLLRVAWGFTNNDIAGELGLSTKTVESYRARACEKLELPDRPAIVKFALMSGWMDEEGS